MNKIKIILIFLSFALVLISCAPTTSQPEGLYFVVGNTLYFMDLDGTTVTRVSDTLPDERQLISANSLTRELYMIRWEANNQLIRVNLDNPETITLLDGVNEGGQGLALDVTKNLVFIGIYYDGVYVSPLDSCCSQAKKIVSAEQLSPTYGQRGQLQLDQQEEYVYFRSTFNGPCDNCRNIWRARYNGEDLKALVPANGGDALALDQANRKMYFSDIPEEINTIKQANLDGTDVKTLLTLTQPYTVCREMAIDSKQGKLYLSLYDPDGYLRRAIASINVDGSDFKILYEVSGNEQKDVSGGIVLWQNK